MATVLGRITKQLLTSVHTPNYSPTDWIINPDLSAVAGYPTKYWVITGDTVTLMTQPEMDVVDAAEESARLDGITGELDRLESVTRALALVMLDELNTLRAAHGLADRTAAQLKTAIRNKLGV